MSERVRMSDTGLLAASMACDQAITDGEDVRWE